MADLSKTLATEYFVTLSESNNADYKIREEMLWFRKTKSNKQKQSMYIQRQKVNT